MKLTNDQEKAFNLIIDGKDVFVTGGGGVGKSYLLKTCVRALERKGKRVLVTAPTGTAAILVQGATIHRTFKMDTGVAVSPKTKRIIKRTTDAVRKADVIIIDEVSMCRMDLFDSVMASIKKAEEAGDRHIQVVLFGDFRQLPPVLTNKRGEKDVLDAYYGRDVGRAYAFEGGAWKERGFINVVLREVVRQADYRLISQLDKARCGDPSCLPYFQEKSTLKFLLNGTFVAAKKAEVDKINEECLANIMEPEQVFPVIISGTVDDSDLIPPASLVLKEGCRVSSIVNDENDLFVNGSIGTVVDIDKRNGTIMVEFLENGYRKVFSRFNWDVYSYSVDEEGEIHKDCIGSYQQFPLRLAYAMTIHKSQGATLSQMNLYPDCFAPGQLYVALSRVKDIRGLHLMSNLRPEYLIADGNVQKFYEELDESITKELRQKGRPGNQYGSTKPLRVPEEIYGDLERLVKNWKEMGPDRYNWTPDLVNLDY